jgi:hypothetical protein
MVFYCMFVLIFGLFWDFFVMSDAEYEFDVFLSHSSEDKPIVLKLAEQLKKDGLEVWGLITQLYNLVSIVGIDKAFNES